VRKVLRMGWIERLNTPALAITMTMGALWVAGFGGIFGNRLAYAGDLSDPPPEQSEVRVTFSPNPAKTGYVKEGGSFASSLLQHVTATVSPPSARDDITFDKMYEADGTGRIGEFYATIMDGVDDSWEFDVGGTYESKTIYPWGDIIIIARYKDSQTVGGERVIVQIPYNIGTPHPEWEGEVDGRNDGLNLGTSPVAPDAPEGYVRVVTQYTHTLNVPVVDQFGVALELYVDLNLPVFEDSININKTLTQAGTYEDPVGVFSGFKINNSSLYIPEGSEEEDAWKAGYGFTYEGVEYPAGPLPMESCPPASENPSISIGGHVLAEGIGNRQVTATAPNHLKITWP
jgi:hypothetical protein